MPIAGSQLRNDFVGGFSLCLAQRMDCIVFHFIDPKACCRICRLKLYFCVGFYATKICSESVDLVTVGYLHCVHCYLRSGDS